MRGSGPPVGGSMTPGSVGTTLSTVSTEGEQSASDRPGVRASDGEREDVVALLSEHTTTGRLTLAELEQRVERAYAATTRAELAQLTADLPAATSSDVRKPATTRRPTKWIVALMGGTSKRGRWRVGERVRVVAIMGGHDIDLRDAELESEHTSIVVVNIMGGSDIYVPDSVEVDIGGFSLMGGTGERGSRRAARHGAPRISISVFNLMGGSDVWRLPDEARELPLRQASKLAKRLE